MLGDCPKCWEHLCHCGYQYRNMIPDDRIHFAAVMLGIPKHAVEETLAGIIPETHPLKEKDDGKA